MVKKACIIDDDKLYVSLIKMLIKKNKLAQELVIFENGKLAMQFFKEQLEKQAPDLPEVVLLDLNMPVMDGWEFLDEMEPYASKIKQEGLKINVVSSTINPVEVAKANSHDIVNCFITKPINKQAMIKAFSI